jgi:hypothetical protein
MESYEQAVDLALMVVNLDKDTYKLMLRGSLKDFLNTQYSQIIKTNNNHEINKFILASKILLNDLQAIPVSSCPYRESFYNLNNCDKNVNYKTPVFEEALIDPDNVVNSNVTKYIDGFNPNTFSRMAQPLDTIGLYHTDVKMRNYNNYDKFYGPEQKIRNKEHFISPSSHPVKDVKNTYYSQYSSVLVNDNGEGYYENEFTNQINDETPQIQKMYKKIHNNKLV